MVSCSLDVRGWLDTRVSRKGCRQSVRLIPLATLVENVRLA